MEYFQHLLEVMTRAERSAGARLEQPSSSSAPTASAFELAMEDRVCCATTGAVSYKRERTNTWSLGIPVEAATNQPELRAFQVRNDAARADLQILQPTWRIGLFRE